MHAGFLKRTIAFVIDAIILSIICSLLFPLLIVLKLYPQNPMNITLTTHLMTIIFFLLIYFFYFIFPEASPWQATLGKKILGIKVVDTHGHRISIGRSVGRNINMILSSMTFCIGYLMCLWTDKSQCLHDMISGCMVVTSDVEPSPEFPPTKPPLIMWFSTVGLLILWFTAVMIPFIMLGNFSKQGSNNPIKENFIAFEMGTSYSAINIMERISEEFILKNYYAPNPNFTWKDFIFAPEGAVPTTNKYCLPSSKTDSNAHELSACNENDNFLIILFEDSIRAYRVGNSPFRYTLVLNYGDKKDKLQCAPQDYISQTFCSELEKQFKK